MKGRILIIAGSDSSGGAGIQADLKTVMALGGYGMTAITAVTVQNTEGVQDVFPIPPEIVAAQMEAVLNDIGADALKTGMLHDAKIIEAVVKVIEEKAHGIPLVVDSVLKAKRGEELLEESALTVLKKKLFPRATIVTPNIPEAEILTGQKINTVADMHEAARGIVKLGAKAALIKGGHLQGDTITDVLWDSGKISEWQSPRIDSTSTHGTGCTLASGIATCLAQGLELKEAVRRARDCVIEAIRAAKPLGHGHGPLDHGWKLK